MNCYMNRVCAYTIFLQHFSYSISFLTKNLLFVGSLCFLIGFWKVALFLFYVVSFLLGCLLWSLCNKKKGKRGEKRKRLGSVILSFCLLGFVIHHYQIEGKDPSCITSSSERFHKEILLYKISELLNKFPR